MYPETSVTTEKKGLNIGRPHRGEQNNMKADGKMTYLAFKSKNFEQIQKKIQFARLWYSTLKISKL